MFRVNRSVTEEAERYDSDKAKLKNKFVAKLQRMFSAKESTSMALRDTVIDLDKEIQMIDGEMGKITNLLIKEHS